MIVKYERCDATTAQQPGIGREIENATTYLSKKPSQIYPHHLTLTTLMETTPEPAAEQIAAEAAPNNADVKQMNLEETAARVRSGAHWFYWIAAMSVINAFLQASGRYFVMGLAIPSLIEAITFGETESPNYVIYVLCAGLIAIFGFFASKLQRWAFITGAIIYVLDGALYALAGEWLAFGFHLFVLYKLYQGFSAIAEYKTISKQA